MTTVKLPADFWDQVDALIEDAEPEIPENAFTIKQYAARRLELGKKDINPHMIYKMLEKLVTSGVLKKLTIKSGNEGLYQFVDKPPAVE